MLTDVLDERSRVLNDRSYVCHSLSLENEKRSDMLHLFRSSSYALFVLTFCLTSQECWAQNETDLVSDGVPNKDSSEETAAEYNITRVTLYRDQALVTRELPISQAVNDVITIDDLPALIVTDSVYAEGTQGIEIRAVRVSSRTSAEADRDDIREIDHEIQGLVRSQGSIQLELDTLNTNATSLSAIVNFTAAGASNDFAKGTIDARQITELTNFLMERRVDLSRKTFELQSELQERQAELRFLQERRSALTASNQNRSYQVKVFIAGDQSAGGSIKLNYLVGGCSWSPQYSIAGSIDNKNFDIKYSAMVRQISGENWENVRLTLSSASPAVNAMGPNLTPLRVSVAPINKSDNDQQAANSSGGYGEADILQRAQSIRRKQETVENTAYDSKSISGSKSRDLQLNSLANQLQNIELEASVDAAAQIASDSEEEVATQIYALPQPLSLQSRREQQLVQIDALKLEGELYHVATPLLASYVYRQAEMTNTQSIGLLGGPATVYLDDRFVGQTVLPSTASGQRLVVGFGADQQVRTRRELRAKQDSIRGGNRNLEFTYRLVISNFKNQTAKVRLFDRIPVSDESRDLSVSLLKNETPLSTDALYERIGKSRGILRWDLEVPAGRSGGEAFDVDYTYSLEFDRNGSLTAEDNQEQIESDYFFDQNAGGMGGGGGGGFFGN